MPAESILGGINQEATQLELLGNLTLLLAAMLERMPRVTGNDQCAVSIEAGSVGIAAGQTLATVTNMAQMGGRPALMAADALNNAGSVYLYNNITVSA